MDTSNVNFLSLLYTHMRLAERKTNFQSIILDINFSKFPVQWFFSQKIMSNGRFISVNMKILVSKKEIVGRVLKVVKCTPTRTSENVLVKNRYTKFKVLKMYRRNMYSGIFAHFQCSVRQQISYSKIRFHSCVQVYTRLLSPHNFCVFYFFLACSSSTTDGFIYFILQFSHSVRFFNLIYKQVFRVTLLNLQNRKCTHTHTYTHDTHTICSSAYFYSICITSQRLMQCKCYVSLSILYCNIQTEAD